ncbi:hypothetical protein [Polymorphospora rubra]|uniref:Toprim domain-containing protein n=1 Tax=Polymorphospora rubra TaxID=338584 RepID=A0A810MVE5_9ACTN|nr:hypothetical protein [Polymorphospora rubra]BCJ65137.1 hypothetical protein Prubr_21580 [Polymorphospora rubra]
MPTAHEWFSGLLDVAGSQPRGAALRQCPAHSDRSPSLSVRPGPEGSVRVKCFTGCTTEQILASVACSRTRLAKPAPIPPAAYAEQVRLALTFPEVVVREGSPASRGYRLEAVHDYGQAALFRWRSRSGDKELVWETRKESGALVPGLIGVTLLDLPLYRESEVRMAMATGEPVLLVESESSVDALRGFYATTWAGGADAVNLRRLVDILVGYPNTVAIPDNDPAGRRWRDRAYAAGIAPFTVWPAEGADARDLWQQLGPTDFHRVVQNTLQEAPSSAGRAA